VRIEMQTSERQDLGLIEVAGRRDLVTGEGEFLDERL
jgi:hypothetical protein